MNISFIFPANLGNARQFLVSEVAQSNVGVEDRAVIDALAERVKLTEL